MGKKKIKKLIAAAGENISKKEYKAIEKAAKGNTAKAINKIAKAGANLNSGAANMLIKEYNSTPSMQYSVKPVFGKSSIGQTLMSRVNTPGTPSFKHGDLPGTSGNPGAGLLIGGTTIRSGGKIAVKKKPTSPTQPVAEVAEVGDVTDTDQYWADRRAGAADRRAAAQQRVAGMRDAVAAYQAENAPPELSDSMSSMTAPNMSIDGMTGGGTGLSSASGLRRPRSSWRRERRTSKGTTNFRRTLQIGNPINFN